MVKAESDFLLLELEWLIVMLKLAGWKFLPVSLLTYCGGSKRDSPGAKLITYVMLGENGSSDAISRHLGGGLQSSGSFCSLFSHEWTDLRSQALVSDSTAVFGLLKIVQDKVLNSWAWAGLLHFKGSCRRCCAVVGLLSQPWICCAAVCSATGTLRRVCCPQQLEFHGAGIVWSFWYRLAS